MTALIQENLPKVTMFCTECEISDGPLHPNVAAATLEAHLNQLHSTRKTSMTEQGIAGIKPRPQRVLSK